MREIWDRIWNNGLPPPFNWLPRCTLIVVLGLVTYLSLPKFSNDQSSSSSTTNSTNNSTKPQTEKITLKVKLVWSRTNLGIEGAQLSFMDGTSNLGNKPTSDQGYTTFEVPRKSGLTIQVEHPKLREGGEIIDVPDLTNIQGDSADVYKALQQSDSSPSSQRIILKVRLVWFGTTQAIEGAQLRLFDGASLIDTKKTSNIGYTTFEVPRKGGLTIQVKHPNLKQDGQIIDVKDLTGTQNDSENLYDELYKK